MSKEALDNMYTLLAIHHLASEKDYLQIKQDLDKLNQLEDIEDELGIDLITLFKALKEGIWMKFKEPEHAINMTFGYSPKGWYWEWDYYVYYFKDYHRTWALTREELENE